MTLQVGVGGDERDRLVPRRADQVFVLQHAEQPQRATAAGLQLVEHISLAALFEVELREREAGVRRGDCVEPRPGGCVRRRARDEQAEPGCTATTDAPAEL